MTNIYTDRQQRILLIASLIIIAGFVLFGLSGYVSAFLGAGILFVVFRPWFTALAIKRHWNRSFVAGLLIVFAFVVIIMPFLTLSLMLINRIQYYSQHTDEILGLVKQLEDLTGYQITSQENIQVIAKQVGTFASRLLPSLASGALNFIVIIGLMLFTLYFMFVQQEAFLRDCTNTCPLKEIHSRNWANHSGTT